MSYNFQYRLYQRHFVHPLKTHHGVWKVREGIIIRLREEGNIRWGEIAPIPWFGSETLTQALNFCQQLGAKITADQIYSIPESLPCCQFAFESALKEFSYPEISTVNHQLKSAYLLPAGEKALEVVQNLIKKGMGNGKWGAGSGEQGVRSREWGVESREWGAGSGEQGVGSREWGAGSGEQGVESREWGVGSEERFSLQKMTLKWKIGVYPLREEIDTLKKLIEILPQGTKVRLDANGGLSLKEAEHWLNITDKLDQIEFLEQPLPPQEFESMLRLSCDYNTPLALDESVATITQLEECYHRGWRGIFVIKAALSGFPSRLSQVITQYDLDGVFSSVFETAIGRQAVLSLAQELFKGDRALGFGVDHWFMGNEDEWLSLLKKQF